MAGPVVFVGREAELSRLLAALGGDWSIPSFVHTWFRVCSCAGWRLLW
jgi:hypothetical protein